MLRATLLGTPLMGVRSPGKAMFPNTLLLHFVISWPPSWSSFFVRLLWSDVIERQMHMSSSSSYFRAPCPGS
jgi:hypothetical protein